jgi:hypothetical protein
VSPQEKNPSELDPAEEEVMQSALHIQSIFLDVAQLLPDIFSIVRWSSVVLKPQLLPHS